MNDIEKLDKHLKNKVPLVAMLAPSFVVDFKYPDIVWKLKKLGFDKVVELTFGAKMTNVYYQNIIKKDKSKTWISSPCPTIVDLVRRKFSYLVKNLLPVYSPMGCMALICKKFYPKHKYVFIGPCITKKNEAKEIKIVELAFTFKEVKELLEKKGIQKVKKQKLTFDKFYNDYTKIYPLAGGLSDTLHHKGILKENEILIEDGIDKIDDVLSSFKEGKYKKIIFFDCLSCKGGCIGGPGMFSSDSLNDRKKRVIRYKNFALNREKDLGRRGKIIHVDNIDFFREF
jgi:iron only hydrogenase large subunit-like protein